MTQKTFTVSGIHCSSCAAIIKRKLSSLDGIESCEVNMGTHKAKVDYDPSIVDVAKMNSELDKFGYAFRDEHEAMGHHDQNSSKEDKLVELANLKKQVTIIIPMIVFSVIVMILEVGAQPLKLWPMLPEIFLEFVHHTMPVFATYSMFTIGLPYLLGVYRFIKFRVANMDTLIGIGTLVAFLYSFIVSAFKTVLEPYLDSMQSYYEVTIIVIGFITLGKYLETRSKLKTGEAIEKLIGLQAKMALVLKDGKEVETPIENIVVGDIVLVKPGQKIPLDGVIIEGKSSIDESMITGESMPVDKNIKDFVIGATINKQGYLKVRVTKTGDDTYLAQIIHMVQEAQGSKAPIEKLTDQISAIFVPVVLAFSVLVLVLWIALGLFYLPLAQAITLGLLSFVGILVIACPCALGLATPTAIIVGVGKAAMHGILIKNAESLEKFNSVNFILFDKTGTITNGGPKLTDVKALGEMTKDNILQLIASLEKNSEHPLAKAVVNSANSKKISLKKVEEFEVFEGMGLRGKIDKVMYYAGNLKLAKKLNLKVDLKIVEEYANQGKTPIVFMTKSKILGYLGVSDTLKTGVKEIITNLESLGMKTGLLTGDNTKTANYVAKLAGIEKVIAEVSPQEKAGEIKKLQSEGYKVAMVGDGINDSVALATADVGVAMGTGTDVAIESAGITLLGGQLATLPKAIKLARATMKTIKQNLFWAFFYNVVGIPIAAGILYPFFGIMLNPAIAGAAMSFSSVSVVANSLRLKSIKL